MKVNLRTLAVCTAICASMMGSSTPVQASFGFCSQPMAPTVFLRKPSKPFCAARRNCTDVDVQMYRNEIDSYFRSLKNYANEVESYYADAAQYVKCMSDLD